MFDDALDRAVFAGARRGLPPRRRTFSLLAIRSRLEFHQLNLQLVELRFVSFVGEFMIGRTLCLSCACAPFDRPRSASADQPFMPPAPKGKPRNEEGPETRRGRVLERGPRGLSRA